MSANSFILTQKGAAVVGETLPSSSPVQELIRHNKLPRIESTDGHGNDNRGRKTISIEELITKLSASYSGNIDLGQVEAIMKDDEPKDEVSLLHARVSLTSDIDSLSNISTMNNTHKSSNMVLQRKPTLPHHLLLHHDTVAFVGLTHDSLAAVFMRALDEEPSRKWSSINIFYASDLLMDNFKPLWNGEHSISEKKYESQREGEKADTNDLANRKQKSKRELKDLLASRSTELRFHEISSHCSFFGSWFGWRAPGGYIHVSPSIWGVDVKMCPSQSYSWELGNEPSHAYNAYMKGIENLLSNKNPFAVPLDASSK